MSRAARQEEMSAAIKREVAGKSVSWQPGRWTRKMYEGAEVPVLCLLGNANTPTLAAYFNDNSVTLAVIKFAKKGVEFQDSPDWCRLVLHDPPYADIDLLAHRIVETAKMFLQFWPLLCKKVKKTKVA